MKWTTEENKLFEPNNIWETVNFDVLVKTPGDELGSGGSGASVCLGEAVKDSKYAGCCWGLFGALPGKLHITSDGERSQ